VIRGMGEDAVDRLRLNVRVGRDRVRPPCLQLLKRVCRIASKQDVPTVVIDGDDGRVTR
jgi:hypothetical protein